MPDLQTVTLRDASSAVTATFVPGAGMVGTSLSDGGVELLGQRHGLQAYLSSGRTMGIPILYPWANRLSATSYAVEGGVVTLRPGAGGCHTDEHGSPIHGVLAAYPGWTVRAQRESQLTAELDYGARPGLLASFPFPHLLRLDVTLAERTLRVQTTVTATTAAPVPLCFGFHPYLQIPEAPRSDWQVKTPAMQLRAVNASGIPTGDIEPHPATTEKLGDKLFDDGYAQVAPGSIFAVSGGGRRIEVCFERGYPAAQVYAPGDDDVICFEPMAAPTDALSRGGYQTASQGEPAVAVFSIRV